MSTAATQSVGAVRLTMFIAALRGGQTFSLSWVGFALAIAGLVYLV